MAAGESVYALVGKEPGERRPESAASRPSTARSGSSLVSSRRTSGSERLAQHHNSSQVASSLNPIRGVRDMQRRLGQQPTDFAKANAQRIRALSARNASAKAELPRSQRSARKHRPGHVPRSVRSSLTERPNSANGSEFPSASPYPRNHRYAENDDADDGADDGTDDDPDRSDEHCEDNEGSSNGDGSISNSPQTKQPRDFVKENAAEVASRAATPRNTKNSQQEDYTKREGYGKVPNYLIQRKVELARQAEERRAAQEAEAVPAGMRIMPEEERLETLELLAKSKHEAYNQLHQMPFVCDTPSQRRAKEEVEKRITELEQAEHAFSRKRVLVKADE
jgi:hypothetical protein